jgi:carboxyl-terminal processing protease
MKKLGFSVLLMMLLSACGGGGGGGASTSSGSSNSSSGTSSGSVSNNLPPYTSLAAQCAAPRPAGTINPLTGSPYNDVQGSLTSEMAWVTAYVNQTYLWYMDVPAVSSAQYYIGANVAYVDPTNNAQGMETLNTNSDVVDAYFNSQRSPLFTASGKPKDQFHFTYQTTVWDALSEQGNEAGFGFQVALLSATPPRKALIAYTSAGTAAAQNNLGRGAQFLSVNGIDVVNDDTPAGIATLNEGLVSPVAGKTYTFSVLDQGATTPRTVMMTASNVALTPVMNVATLPAPNNAVGYILFNDHIAPAESELIAAVNQLKASNNGTGISDLVLDIRYNGGGLLDIASELAYMIAGSSATSGKFFEQETFNNKNPFNFTTAQDTLPFHSTAQGFSTATGQPLPQLGLPTVYVITTSATCSASEAIINSLRGVGVKVVQVGSTTCGKPYGFYPQDNCSTTYFTIQFEGVNNAGFGGYADGFIPAGTGSSANNLPGCAASDDFTKQLGDPTEANLAAALQYRANGTCPAPIASTATGTSKWLARLTGKSIMIRSPARENRIIIPGRRHSM